LPERRDDPAPGAARRPGQHLGHGPEYRDEIAVEDLGGHVEQRRELVVESGERRARPRVEEVGRPAALVDERAQRGVVESLAGRFGAAQPPDLEGEARGVGDRPDREAELAERRDPEAHRAHVVLGEQVAEHEAQRYIDFGRGPGSGRTEP
jgi:hypothetical protein